MARLWSLLRLIMKLSGAYPTISGMPVPKHKKTDAIPWVSQVSIQIWLITHAALPCMAEEVYYFLLHRHMHWSLVAGLYMVSLELIVIREFRVLRQLAHNYGFLDGEVHERDGIPDHYLGHVILSLFKVTSLRVGMTIFLVHSPPRRPSLVVSSWSWWPVLCLAVSMYSVVLDFYFYWYHRALHDIRWLRQYHRAHHRIKHPVAMLAAFADGWQQLVEFLVIPWMTFQTLAMFGLPLDFYQWWTCHVYIIFAEVWGHSGVRLHFSPPVPLISLLMAFEIEGGTEDHDLHHRQAWSGTGGNYSKQSRLWDRLFGTAWPRIESTQDNIDFAQPVMVPFW